MTGAGDLREVLRFERHTRPVSDGYGNVEGDWATLFTTAARVRPISGREEIGQDALRGPASYEITIRWAGEYLGLAPSDRAVDDRNGRRFALTQTINEDEHRRYINIIATDDLPTVEP